MKAILKFDLSDSEDQSEFNSMMKAKRMEIALERIHDRVFRPNIKHGYGKPIDELIDKCGHNNAILEYDRIYNGQELIFKLQEIYNGILEELDLR